MFRTINAENAIRFNELTAQVDKYVLAKARRTAGLGASYETIAKHIAKLTRNGAIKAEALAFAEGVGK